MPISAPALANSEGSGISCAAAQAAAAAVGSSCEMSGINHTGTLDAARAAATAAVEGPARTQVDDDDGASFLEGVVLRTTAMGRERRATRGEGEGEEDKIEARGLGCCCIGVTRTARIVVIIAILEKGERCERRRERTGEGKR